MSLRAVMLFEQPARTSNKFELWARIPDTSVTVVSNREGWGTERTIVLPVLRLPLLGGFEGWTAAPALLRGVRKIDPEGVDIVASHELYSFTSQQASRYARRHGIAHVVHISETMPTNPIYKIPPYSLITRRVVRSAQWFICTTERARQHAIALGCPADRCSVVHSGIETSVFHPAENGLQTEPEVLFVGMLRANRGADKGVRELVAAADLLAAAGTPAHVSLVGDGHLRPELETLATTRDHLDVVGRVPREEIPALMRSVRLLVLPSKRTWKWEEQFGFVLAEAMSSGLPVVASTCGSIPEIVPPWNPLVPEGDAHALAAGIREALGAAGDESGRKNRAWAEEHFEMSSQARRLREALEAALAAGHRTTS